MTRFGSCRFGKGTLAVLLLTLVGFLGACTNTPTLYQPATSAKGFGYHDEQIDADTWRVSFAGNNVTSRNTVEDYLLYRSAEITEAQGADGFVVLENSIDKDVAYSGTSTVPSSSVFIGSGRSSGSFFGFGTGIGTTSLRPINSYTGYARIRLFKALAPEGQGEAYDAKAILRVLGPKIQRPAPDAG